MAETIGKAIVFLIIAALVISVGWLVIKSAIAHQDWLDSHCMVIGEISGSYVYSSNGHSGWTSGKTGYKCDDGKEYWE